MANKWLMQDSNPELPHAACMDVIIDKGWTRTSGDHQAQFLLLGRSLS
jgi:hypothetical protein